MEKTTKKKNGCLRKPMVMEVGRRYKGSAMINEYGEIEFRPYQQDPDAQPRFRGVRGSEGDVWRLMTSKTKVRMVLTVDRDQLPRDVQESLRNAFITALTELKAYDVRPL